MAHGRGASSQSSFPNNAMVLLPLELQSMLGSKPQLAQDHIATISVPDLLEYDVLHQGFLYKRASDRKTDKVTDSVHSVFRMDILNKWRLRYVIIYQHFVVYYKNDKAKKPYGIFSLKDYNRVVRAEEMVSSERRWPFKIIGMRASARTWYFCAPSEREMRLWMACFKATMDHAIHGKVKQSCLDIIQNNKQRTSSVPEHPTFEDSSRFSASSTLSSCSSHEPQNYEDLETPADFEAFELYDDISNVEDDIFSPPSSERKSHNNEPLERWKMATKLYHENGQRHEAAYLSFSSDDDSDSLSDAVDNEDDTDPYDDPDSDCKSGRQLPSTRRLPPPGHAMPLPPVHAKPLPRLPDHSQSLPYQHGHAKPLLPPSGHSTLPKEIRDIQKKLENQGFSKIVLKPPGIRREPDGKSFRIDPQEHPKLELPPVPAPRDLQSPVREKPQPVKSAKPRMQPKPNRLPKQAPSLPGTRTPKLIIPESAIFRTTDKKITNDALWKHSVDGMFLLRDSSKAGKQQVLMVWHNSLHSSKHYTIFGDNVNKFALDSKVEHISMEKLVEYYKQNLLPNSDIKLTIPCPS